MKDKEQLTFKEYYLDSVEKSILLPTFYSYIFISEFENREKYLKVQKAFEAVLDDHTQKSNKVIALNYLGFVSNIMQSNLDLNHSDYVKIIDTIFSFDKISFEVLNSKKDLSYNFIYHMIMTINDKKKTLLYMYLNDPRFELNFTKYTYRTVYHIFKTGFYEGVNSCIAKQPNIKKAVINMLVNYSKDKEAFEEGYTKVAQGQLTYLLSLFKNQEEQLHKSYLKALKNINNKVLSSLLTQEMLKLNIKVSMSKNKQKDKFKI